MTTSDLTEEQFERCQDEARRHGYILDGRAGKLTLQLADLLNACDEIREREERRYRAMPWWRKLLYRWGWK